MNFIRDKKIHKYIVIAVLFLSFGFTDFFSVRGTLAMYSNNGLFEFNDVVAFISAAIMGGLIYELIIMLFTRGAVSRLGARAYDMKYSLRFFVIASNVCSGLVKLLYLRFPYVFSYGEIFIDFIFMTAFFSLFLWFACKSYCQKQEYARTVMYLGSSFLCFYGIIAILSLLMGVLA